MTCVITEGALISFLKAQYFVAFLAYLRVHDVDLDVLVGEGPGLYRVQSLPVAARRDIVSIMRDEIPRHHLNDSLVAKLRAASCSLQRWRVDKRKVLIADAQYEVLRPLHVVVLVPRYTLIAAAVEIILGALIGFNV